MWKKNIVHSVFPVIDTDVTASLFVPFWVFEKNVWIKKAWFRTRKRCLKTCRCGSNKCLLDDKPSKNIVHSVLPETFVTKNIVHPVLLYKQVWKKYRTFVLPRCQVFPKISYIGFCLLDFFKNIVLSVYPGFRFLLQVKGSLLFKLNSRSFGNYKFTHF